MQLSYLLEAYRLFPEKDKFFIASKSGKWEESFFTKLAGNTDLMDQIKAGKTETEICQSWQPALTKFKEIRKKYLLYD